MLQRYGSSILPSFAAAFHAAGARDISDALLAIAADPGCSSARGLANELITRRAGYSYESICVAMAREA